MAEYLIQSETLEAIGEAIRAKEESSDLIPVADFAARINALGAGLNFAVVGGTTQPADPKENTIWVSTDVEITSWILSATEPAEPAEGMVWISTDTASESEFNALKKNALQVCPRSAKQYVSGAWVEKDTQIYQNGEWIQFVKEFVIYDSGTFGKSTSGTTFSVSSSDDNNAASITENSSYMSWELGEYAWGIFYVSPKISCTGYKTLNISLKNASMDAGDGFYWGLSSSTNYEGTGYVSKVHTDDFSGDKVISLDVSNVGDTAYYLALQLGTYSNTSFSVEVHKIWLE